MVVTERIAPGRANLDAAAALATVLTSLMRSRALGWLAHRPDIRTLLVPVASTTTVLPIAQHHRLEQARHPRVW